MKQSKNTSETNWDVLRHIEKCWRQTDTFWNRVRQEEKKGCASRTIFLVFSRLVSRCLKKYNFVSERLNLSQKVSSCLRDVFRLFHKSRSISPQLLFKSHAGKRFRLKPDMSQTAWLARPSPNASGSPQAWSQKLCTATTLLSEDSLKLARQV